MGRRPVDVKPHPRGIELGQLIQMLSNTPCRTLLQFLQREFSRVGRKTAREIIHQADQTLTELWHFRLKGAPEPIYRRALGYFNLVNSPSTMVNADDLWNFWKGHQGLASDGGDWSNMHRWFGTDQPRQDGGLASTMGTSEAPLRNMFTAWRNYMAESAP